MNVEIEVLEKGDNKYLKNTWMIKQNIRRKNNLLRQRKDFFEDTYIDSVKYIAKDDDDKIVGFSTIINSNYIALFGVSPRLQNKGVGSKLLESMKNDYDNLVCHTRISNNSALNFYESNGFVIDEIVDNYYRNNEDAYYLKYEK